jgi:hypothetical protein
MANNCFSLLTFWGNAKVQDQVNRWKEQLATVDVPATDESRLEAIRLVFYPNVPSDQQIDYGCKWVHVEDEALSPEAGQIAFCSAWERPGKLEEHIASLLYKLDKKVVIRNNFNISDGSFGIAYTAPYDEEGAYSQQALVNCAYDEYDDAQDAEDDANERLEEEECQIIENFVDDMPQSKSVLKKNLPKGKIDWSSL